MIGSIFLLAASAASAFDPAKVAVDYNVVAPSDLAVPISDSVVAATWDELQDKPADPVTVRLACIVLRYSGGPGRCIPSESVPRGKEQVNWDALTKQIIATNKQRPAAELELERLAERRINQSRVVPDHVSNELMIIRFFDVVIGPADARPLFDTDNPLTLGDVSFARPLDTSLIQSLFPPVAMRSNFSARVRVICRIQESGTLLCRDPGSVQALPAGAFDQSNQVTQDFRFATYQIVSTMKIEPKTKRGEEVEGRNLAIGITWAM